RDAEVRRAARVAWAEYELSNGHAVVAVKVLRQVETAALSSEQALAVRFLLAEALFAAGKPELADEQFDWLTKQAEVLSPKPEWLAAVALRRGELLVRARDIPAARRWLLQAKRDHADFALAYEFDYLLARCAVAQIEFDQARVLLQQVISAPAAHGTEAAARAAWMLGEVYFLQRKYPQAMDAYEQVARMTAFPDWQARALLQSAKCHELLGQAAQALADYQRALQLSQQPDIQQQATERVGAIESLSPTLR
ncbi:MAG: tetratricopeptide repeat protein, partial [Aureliella sp.]